MSITASVGRRGANRSADVRLVQALLNKNTAPPIPVDGLIGGRTLAAIEAYQRKLGMAKPDGLIEPGGKTITALTGGSGGAGPVAAALPKPAAVAQAAGVDWPPKPAFSPLVGDAQRAALFSKFEYDWDPQPPGVENGYETIRVKGNWAALNIVSVAVDMGPKVGKRTLQVHRLVAKQMKGVWEAWGKAGLLDRVLTYNGSYVPRFGRATGDVKAAMQRPKSLSNHAFGTAFDINVKWNGLHAVPPAVGAEGSVRELVPLAHEWGFYWGGHFKRLDGMHFEVAKIL
jgi:peptidoglycan hydrolase-like protein with peptidoglycan-binding domain